MKTKLIWVTPDSENLIAYCARVSNPSNQNNPEYSKLLQYLIKHRHWSPFEMSSACVEIETSRRIAPQILRHRSFSFQEFSQRYAEVQEFEEVHPRRQDLKNRQNSIDDLDENVVGDFLADISSLEFMAVNAYKNALANGISKESAAFLLPPTAKTHIYMAGTIRSFIHYIDVRTKEDTQLEHRQIACAIRDILYKELPNIGKALEWPIPTDQHS